MNNQSVEEAFLVHQQFFRVEMTAGLLSKLIFAITICLLFVYINSVMFHALLSKPVFRELPRYILFAHMLCNDSVQLLSTITLYLLTVNFHAIPKALCAFLSLIGTASFRNAGLNLAVMSLERYVAICFPLRHSEIVNQKSAGVSIGMIWILSSINVVIDIIYALIVSPVSFANPMLCTRARLVLSQWQIDVFEVFNYFCFVTVTGILIFSYVSVVLAARSASKNDSAKKAQRTILLHFGQLVLCVNSFLFGTIERALYMASSSKSLFIELRYINFLFVLLLPRCLSPLIYGLRDDAVRPLFLYYVRCGSRKVKPSVIMH
ncbi:odorant receptor 131-2-like [Engraulis encrasicolus]|uniref:odorant receptor 131-2-like n=1 Tax=Engraulis encrasicolus TaxID=184585 RepID=UPI002FD253F5